MLKRFFITGTDTSVGKTVVSRALLQALASGGKSVAGYKPVAKGSKETAEGMRNKDALVLQSVSSLELPYEAINPIALSEDIFFNRHIRKQADLLDNIPNIAA